MTMSVTKLWSLLEIRVLLVISLTIQIALLFLAGLRKFVIETRLAKEHDFTWKGPLGRIFHGILWLAYLLADYVATVALAFLRDDKENNNPGTNNPDIREINAKHLLIFWAPFFLVHLGGQDTITALSIEDNELWARHLVTLVTQASLAAYNYFMSNMHVTDLWAPAALMFIVGCLKYSERIWALERASMSALRSSMITKPDPGPNYAKFMQEYTSSKAAGLSAEIRIEVERHIPVNKEINEESTTENETKSKLFEKLSPEEKIEVVKEVVIKAYGFFPRFKRLFVDLILSYKDREDSQKYFSKLTTYKAYKLIEIELTWMYDILHSKASVFYSISYYGWASRAFTLLTSVISLVLFALGQHTHYRRSDVALTYMLLGAAVTLEAGAVAFMITSFWAYAVMKEYKGWRENLADILFPQQVKWHSLYNARWSNKMAQFSLIKYSLYDKPYWLYSFMKAFGFKQSWDHYRYATFVEVNENLKHLVFEELKKKLKGIEDRAGYKTYTEHRGQWALQRKGYYKEFGWSVEVEFDESLLLWHIATDLLYNSELGENKDKKPKDDNYMMISQRISNYMMFIMIARPFMMPAGIGQIRFGDSSAEAKNFFEQQLANKIPLPEAAKMILDVSTEYDPALIKGDRSKSLLFDGCKLAHELLDELGKDRNRMWMLISQVWVEMLCYSASKCSGQFHAKQLSKGGELLTVVWFLMAHLGMGEQYRIEQGHARAKLIVSK